MNKKLLTYAYYIFVGLLIYYGFKFVGQVGQGVGVVQNDGYTVTGGILLFLAGLLIGFGATKKKGRK